MENEMDKTEKQVDDLKAYKTILPAIQLLLQDYVVSPEPARAGFVLADPCRTRPSAVDVLQAAENIAERRISYALYKKSGLKIR